MKTPIAKSFVTGIAVTIGVMYLFGAHVDWPARSQAAVVTPTPVATANVQSLSDTFATLSKDLSPAVVSIYTRSKPDRQGFNMPALPPGLREQFEEQFGSAFVPFNVPQMSRETLGSGFVIDADKGYIATNAHVVRMAGHNADEIMVKFVGEENSKGHAAKVVGADEVSDVALLKLVDKKPGLKAIAMGDSSKARVGEWVLAIGNPYGHTNTVTEGIISALGRSVEGARSEFLQTSAGINPGNSGGPLINMNGEVVGINSMIDKRAQNIGFAIPINSAKEVIAQLESGGQVHRAWLGVGIEDLNDETAEMMRLHEADGVLVRQVVEDTPAAKAGIERFDVIRKIGGEEVHNTHDLFRSIEKAHAGDVATIEVLRGGSQKTIKIRFGEEPTKT